MDLLNKIITKLPKLKEETTDETLDSGYFDQVKNRLGNAQKAKQCQVNQASASQIG